MKRAIPHLIHYDQAAYENGRFIDEPIRIIDDILYLADQENSDGILFAVDMEKAFDSLEHAFIFATLAKFGFGMRYIKWIGTFLYNGSSCIMNKSISTGYFSLKRGARQSGPLSPYVYILCLEILLIKIRINKAIQGF